MDKNHYVQRYQLDSCVWELTNRCNMACIHCGSRAGENSLCELTREEALDAANQLLDLRCRRVTLIGGEFSLCSYWADVALRLTQGGAICDVVTNGYRKSTEELRDYARVGLASVAISVDGFGETHNRIRRNDHAFSEAERFCCRIREMKRIPLTAVTTITRLCLDELELLCDWMIRQGVEIWQWQQVSPMGRASDHEGLCLTSSDVEKVMELYLVLRKHIPILLADNLGYYYTARNKKVIHPFHGCAAGLCVVGLDSAGNVRGCESLYDSRFVEGNLRERKLRDIWEDPNAFAYNRQFQVDALTGKCSTCSYGKYCAGGCRSFNAFHGKLYESVNCVCNYEVKYK